MNVWTPSTNITLHIEQASFTSFSAEFHKVDSSMLKIRQLHFSFNRTFGKIYCLSGKQCRFQESCLTWIYIFCKNFICSERVKHRLYRFVYNFRPVFSKGRTCNLDHVYRDRCYSRVRRDRVHMVPRNCTRNRVLVPTKSK